MKRSSTFLNLLSVIMLLAVVAGVVFFINPAKTQIDDMTVDLSAKEVQIADLQARVAELELLQEELGSSGISSENLLAQVPQGMNQDEVVDDLTGLATEAGITLHGMSFSNAAGEEGSVLTVSSSFDGEYEDLVTFLEALEDNSRKIIAKSISVQLSTEDDVPHASFSLLMEAYYQ